MKRIAALNAILMPHKTKILYLFVGAIVVVEIIYLIRTWPWPI